jgi:uncharacterized membrane protein YqaE (UPF0057 family)
LSSFWGLPIKPHQLSTKELDCPKNLQSCNNLPEYTRIATDRLKIELRFQEEKEFMLLKIIIAVVLPPLSVFLTTGVSLALLINIGLTLIGWLPGMIHALWILNKQSEAKI